MLQQERFLIQVPNTATLGYLDIHIEFGAQVIELMQAVIV